MLQVDAVAARLLAVGASKLRWPHDLIGLTPTDARRLAEAHGDAPASAVRLRVQCAGNALIWCGGPDGDGGWAGLVMADPEVSISPATPAPPDAFVASVSHELRTPLNAILGFVQLAEAQTPEQAMRTSLPGIADSSRQMLRVVNDLLDLAALEAGRLDIDVDQPLSPSLLLTEVGEQAAALRGSQPVRIHAQVDPRCPLHVRGDVGRLHQLLMNLVANALKFTPRGELVMGVRLCHLDGDSVRLRWSVADTGLGMHSDALDRLGQPFERADAAAAGRGAGSGLGLALVQRLLDLHGSRLHLASVSGGGTLAWFDLVLALDRSAPQQPVLSDACLLSTDRRAQASVATQWLAYGQTLLPSARASKAARWLLDAAHPRAERWRLRARREGRLLTVFRTDPVEAAEGGEIVPLPLLARHCWGSAVRPGTARDPLLAGLRVLVVEDNLLSQHVLSEYLAQEGAQATLAVDVAGGCRAARAQRFDVAILDVQLPDGSGFGCAAELRRQLGPGCPALIFLSAHAGPDERLRAEALGALACLSKPFETAQLRAWLRRVVTRTADDAPQAPASSERMPPARHRSGPAESPPPRSASSDPSLGHLFATSWPALREDLVRHLGAAATDGTRRAPLRQSLHALRGSLAVLGAREATALAGRLETDLVNGLAVPVADLHRLVELADAWAVAWAVDPSTSIAHPLHA